MVTDPIADFLIRLQNASRVGHDRVVLPYSKMKAAIATLLEREGYIDSIAQKGKLSRELEVALRYDKGRPAISGSKRISKPSRRMYLSSHDIRPVKRGHGLLVLSTPMGVLSGKEAKEKKVGGEALFEMW